jgi:hypothetical protein
MERKKLMRKSTVYLIIGIAATAIVVAAGIGIALYSGGYDVEHIL